MTRPNPRRVGPDDRRHKSHSRNPPLPPRVSGWLLPPASPRYSTEARPIMAWPAERSDGMKAVEILAWLLDLGIQAFCAIVQNPLGIPIMIIGKISEAIQE